MNFLKALFGNSEITPEEEKKNKNDRQFDLLKYDGVKAMKTGRFDYAVKCFEESLRLNDDLEVHDYLSRALVQTGDNQQALVHLLRLIDAQPENKALLMQAAHVTFLMADYDAMMQYCERALEIDAGFAPAHFSYARAFIGKGEFVNAIARLTKCIALDEMFANAYLLRGVLLLKLGDVNGASADVKWLMEHAEEHEDVLLLAARVQRAKGNTDEAILLYNKVNDANPFQLDAYRERGQLRFEQGDKQGAQEDMRKVLELNPDEVADVSGEYSAEGIEHKVKQAYSALNPFGL